MKKFTFVLLTVASSLAFVNCSSDDDKGGDDCFECTELGVTVKYCKKGDNEATMTVVGTGVSQTIPLGGMTWAEFKEVGCGE